MKELATQQALIDSFSKLPGVGAKSAGKVSFPKLGGEIVLLFGLAGLDKKLGSKGNLPVVCEPLNKDGKAGFPPAEGGNGNDEIKFLRREIFVKGGKQPVKNRVGAEPVVPGKFKAEERRFCAAAVFVLRGEAGKIKPFPRAELYRRNKGAFAVGAEAFSVGGGFAAANAAKGEKGRESPPKFIKIS